MKRGHVKFFLGVMVTGILVGGVLLMDRSRKEEQQEIKREVSVEELFGELELGRGYKKVDANNALYTQRFGADPGVMVYDGRVYVYTTNDLPEYDANGSLTENTYGLIRSINCISSDDLVNWTDHGAISVAGADGVAKWATNSWAPCATHKKVNGKEKFYLFFANGGNGISVLTSDTPTGPWEDPLGKALITRTIKNCEDVTWLFDPAVLVDDDGVGYLYFGGGVPDGKEENPGTARVVRLSEDLLSLDGEVQKLEVPYLFEDSGINKIDGKYYYSYCSNFGTDGNSLGIHSGAIQYMVSDSPMGPFSYVGELFENPGKFFGNGGNNHHAIFEFQGEFYLAYHARTLEKAMGMTGNYRSPHIDKIIFDGQNFEKVIGTYEGVEQVKALNPYKEQTATTMSDQAGVTVSKENETEILQVHAGNWIKLSGVDFKSGAKCVSLRVRTDEKTAIKITTKPDENENVCYLEIPDTQGQIQKLTFETDAFAGIQNLYFVFAGDMELFCWQFEMDEFYVEEPDALKEIYKDVLMPGMCLNTGTIAQRYETYVTKHFSSITCENEMKPDAVLKKDLCVQKVAEDASYVAVDFSACKNIIDYCVKNNLKMRYHTLVWQNQTPDWFFYEDYDTTKNLADKETMEKRMEHFITQVILYFDENYPELIHTIDVVNEAFNGAAEYKVTDKDNYWYQIMGTDYVYYAFYYARKALDESVHMKSVSLAYNDYNMLYKEKTVAEGLEKIFLAKSANVHDYVDVIGFQGHIDINVDISAYTKILKAYSDLGYEVQITELDVGIPKIKTSEEPTKEQYISQGEYLKKMMERIMELKEEGMNLTSITLWGINDANSWRKSVDGYNAYGLLWDKKMNPKPALRGFALCPDVVY